MAETTAFEAMDSASATLILQMLETDSEELLSGGKGKGKEGDLSDRDLATGLFLEELRQQRVIIADRAMSHSITRAVITDADVLNDFAAQEQIATQDRAAAVNLLHGNRIETPQQHANHDPSAVDENVVTRLFGLYVLPVSSPTKASHKFLSCEDDDNESIGESSRWAASKQAASAMSPCVACNSSKPAYKLFKAPCGHIYCDECLEHLFELATTDESLFPPRCCKTQIPVETAKLYLSKGTIESFSEKIIEFGTPNRTYCFRPSCSSFLPPSSVVGDKGTCPQCGAATCTICKGESHSNDCPQDIATQEVLELASREGWQRCFNCKRLVELNFGCNHMSCPCGTEFCYRCGLEWKICPCPTWDETRLTVRAEQFIARRPGPAIPQGQVREEVLGQAIEHLRQRPACQHTEWQLRRGESQCEQCFRHLNRFFYDCTGCHIHVCSMCRRHRF